MSLEQHLRDSLAEQAERCEPPLPVFGALTAGGLSRRHHRRVVVALSAVAVLVILAVGLALGRVLQDSRGVNDPVEPPGVVKSTQVAWCVPDPDDPDGEELIVGAGPPVKTWCSYSPRETEGASWDLARVNYLWQHGGSTVVVRPDGVYRVADGRLTQLGTATLTSSPNLNVFGSPDGRYVAVRDGRPCGDDKLAVYQFPTGEEIATTKAPAPGRMCFDPAGVDDSGRVYATVSERGTAGFEVLMYDPAHDEWTPVTGIPASNGHEQQISYFTADGFAVATDAQFVEALGFWLPTASVEGVVDPQGRFVQQRPVPVGAGLWSPDRSLVVDPQPEGVVVRPDADLTKTVRLDLPVDQFGTPETSLLNIQWESANSVVVQRVPDGPVNRCDVRSGACKAVDRDGSMAFVGDVPNGG